MSSGNIEVVISTIMLKNYLSLFSDMTQEMEHNNKRREKEAMDFMYV